MKSNTFKLSSSSVAMMLALVAVMGRQAAAQMPTMIPPHVQGNFTFDPPIFQDFFEGKTMQVMVSPTECYADKVGVNLTVKLLDPRLARVSNIRRLSPGTPRNDKFDCPEKGEDTTCWRFVITFEAVQLGLSPSIITVIVPPQPALLPAAQTADDEPVLLPAVAAGDGAASLTPGSAPEGALAPMGPPKVNVTLKMDRFDLVVAREPRPLDSLFLIFLMVFITLLNFGFGCSLNLELVVKILKRPIAPAIGFACQFCIMPLLSFGITSLMPINRMLAFGLVVLGCSPGGGGSNVWTLLLKGNVDLSITMTFISICSCLFMMPFWLFTLSRFYVDPSRVTVPFSEIFKTLLAFVIPCLIGIIIRKKKPHIADNFMKVMKPLSVGFIVYILTFGLYVNSYIYRMMISYPFIVPAAFLLPWCGFGFGFLVARILRQPRPNAVTIAIETGIQNYSIAMVVLLGAFPKPYGDLAAVMPLVVAHFTPLPLFAVFLILTIRDKIKARKTAKAAAAAGIKLGDDDADEKKPMKSDCIENGETTHLSREDTLLARGEILGLSASAPSYANGHGQGQGQGSSFQGQVQSYSPNPSQGYGQNSGQGYSQNSGQGYGQNSGQGYSQNFNQNQASYDPSTSRSNLGHNVGQGHNPNPGGPEQQVKSWTFLEVGDGYIIGRKTDAYTVDRSEIAPLPPPPPSDNNQQQQQDSPKDQVEELWYKCLKESNI